MLASTWTTACGTIEPHVNDAQEHQGQSEPHRASQQPASEQAHPPMPGLQSADHLILPEEKHFKHLWQVTNGGENAEAYWSFDGRALSFQSKRDGAECDAIYMTSGGGQARMVSSGRGTTTCAYYLPNGESILFASTHSAHEVCPPAPDRSQGYVWALYPEFDIFATHLETGATIPLIEAPGYDAEATVSPKGDRMVFTSTRSGDVELWTSRLDGSDLLQVTDEVGYDGGAFYSPDGEWLVFRTTAFSEENRDQEIADYKRLLAQDLVRPSRMELTLIRADGTQRRTLTRLGGANFAPSFFPDGKRIIFSSNHHDNGRPALNFDLFAIDTDGGNLERITFYNGDPDVQGPHFGKQFDSFPLFSPDGRYLAFSSNRGDGPPGDTNVFIAEWQ